MIKYIINNLNDDPEYTIDGGYVINIIFHSKDLTYFTCGIVDDTVKYMSIENISKKIAIKRNNLEIKNKMWVNHD